MASLGRLLQIPCRRCCQESVLHSPIRNCAKKISSTSSFGYKTRCRRFEHDNARRPCHGGRNNDGSRTFVTTSGCALRETRSDDKVGERGESGSIGSASSGKRIYNGRSSLVQHESPSFKVSKLSYDGCLETVDLKTSELLKSANIYARDLFSLHLTSRQERYQSRPRRVRRPVSAILPRGNVIVLSFGNIRAVVGLEHVFLFEAHMPAVQDFAHHMANKYESSNRTAEDAHQGGGLRSEPNELVFLEEVLSDTIDCFNRRLRLYEPIVDSFLDKVANEVYSNTGVHLLVPLKDSLQSFEMQVKQSLECVTDLLNDDDEMLDLLLTEQAAALEAGSEVAFARHEHVELLLGVYARQLSNIVMEINYMLGRLQSKQEFVALALAGYRNRMVRMNVHISIAGLSFAVGTTVAGFFGMNLISGLEESTTAFYSVIAFSGMTGVLIATGSLNYLSGQTMQKRASQRLDEIETLAGALSDMSALDYTLKTTVEKGINVDKDNFAAALEKARQSKRPTRKEVDLLFDVFDKIKDGQLTGDDFNPRSPARSRSNLFARRR